MLAKLQRDLQKNLLLFLVLKILNVKLFKKIFFYLDLCDIILLDIWMSYHQFNRNFDGIMA